ncbi:hypothetical protein RDWZM_008680, partial [Blomia tropicalis]
SMSNRISEDLSQSVTVNKRNQKRDAIGDHLTMREDKSLEWETYMMHMRSLDN